MRITRWGLYSNVLLTVSKAVVGVMAGSVALVADAVHSLSDLFSDLVTMLTLKFSSKGPDEDHPYGHGRIEVGGLAGDALDANPILPCFS